MKRTFYICILIFFFCLKSSAYILRTQTILDRSIEANGTGVYQVESEVVFDALPEPFILKETWQIKDQDIMRLTVVGVGRLRDLIHMNFIFYNGQKVFLTPSGKNSDRLTDDFFERIFHFRKSAGLFAALMQLNIFKSSPPASPVISTTTVSASGKRLSKPVKEFQYPADPNVRLARIGGVTAYAFGDPANSSDTSSLPGIWIEQDQFQVRKLRLKSGVEIVNDKFSNYSRGLFYPRLRTVRWGAKIATINTLSVSGIADKPNLFSSANLEKSSDLQALSLGSEFQAVQEFYKRFR